MMRILLQHATRYRIRSFGTLSSPTAARQTLQHRVTDAFDRNAQILPVLEQWRQQGNQVNPSHMRVIIKKLRDSDQSLQALQRTIWVSSDKDALKDKRMNKPVTPLLEQWEDQMKPSHLKCLIKNLRDSNQFSKALQVSEWMGKKRVCNLYSEDYAARLYLTNNVLGLEKAEKYFENIPENMKDYSVYEALLSSYAKSDKNLGKAMSIFKKMRELGFLLKLSPFNLMLSLHSQENMVEEILREMEENNVDPDSLTVNNVLKVYAAESKVEYMEMFMKHWGREDGIKLERGTMVAMAKAYAKSGSTKKAIEMYGNVAGCKREVHHLWVQCKKKKEEEVDDNKEKLPMFSTLLKIDDDEYRTVISSLLKLDDVKGAEKVYGECKPNGPKLDLSIPGLLISRFCTEGNALKVEEMLKSIRKKRIEMHSKMLKDFTVKVVTVFAICVVVLVFLFLDISLRCHR